MREKKPEKNVVFCQTPLGPPPPVWHFFKKKNLPPFFLLKIASLMAETNFTLGPTSKTNKFHLLFLVIVGQNSQHKRANLNGRTPLDIYSNNFRPSGKHVLGVLEWFYMLTEKILFQNRQCFRKWNLVLRTWGQKLFNGEKKDFWIKKGPVIELLRTFSRYFRNNARRS